MIIYAMIIYENYKNCGRNFIKANEIAPNLKYYPLILFLCYIPLTIKRIMESNGKDIPFEFELWSSTWIRLLAFFNVLAYMFRNEELSTLLNRLRADAANINIVSGKDTQDRL